MSNWVDIEIKRIKDMTPSEFKRMYFGDFTSNGTAEDARLEKVRSDELGRYCAVDGTRINTNK